MEFDRCRDCHGLWFDAFEHEALKATPGSEVIDRGPAKPGGREGPKHCPRCAVRMIDMVVPTQAHIAYESCPVCHGVYFDAGEFADFREETFGETLRALAFALRGR